MNLLVIQLPTGSNDPFLWFYLIYLLKIIIVKIIISFNTSTHYCFILPLYQVIILSNGNISFVSCTNSEKKIQRKSKIQYQFFFCSCFSFFVVHFCFINMYTFSYYKRNRIVWFRWKFMRKKCHIVNFFLFLLMKSNTIFYIWTLFFQFLSVFFFIWWQFSTIKTNDSKPIINIINIKYGSTKFPISVKFHKIDWKRLIKIIINNKKIMIIFSLTVIENKIYNEEFLIYVEKKDPGLQTWMKKKI